MWRRILTEFLNDCERINMAEEQNEVFDGRRAAEKENKPSEVKPNEPSDERHFTLPESGYSKFLRMLLFFPVSLGELILRGVINRFGEPKNIIADRIFDFFSLIFWPQRLIDRLPRDLLLDDRYHRAVIRIVNFLLLTTLIMFAFPPLAGALGGAAILSVALEYLPAGFSALVAFCIVGMLYTTVFQYFNRSDLDKHGKRMITTADELVKLAIDDLRSSYWLNDSQISALSHDQIKNLKFVLGYLYRNPKQPDSCLYPHPYTTGIHSWSETFSQVLNIKEKLKDYQMENLSSIFHAINSNNYYKKIFGQILKTDRRLSTDEIGRMKLAVQTFTYLEKDWRLYSDKIKRIGLPDGTTTTTYLERFSMSEILALTPVQCHNLAQLAGSIDFNYGDKFEKILCLENKITDTQLCLLHRQFWYPPEEYDEEYQFLQRIIKRGDISLEQGLELTQDNHKLATLKRILFEPWTEERTEENKLKALKELIAHNNKIRDARLARLGMYAFLTPLGKKDKKEKETPSLAVTQGSKVEEPPPAIVTHFFNNSRYDKNVIGHIAEFLGSRPASPESDLEEPRFPTPSFSSSVDDVD